MKNMNRYIAYFDLLGTTELAQSDHTAFFNSLVTFRNTITHCAKVLQPQDGVYFFSDCAFVETDDLDRLVSYLREFRRHLLEEGYYVIGAVGPGSLEATGPFPRSRRMTKGSEKPEGESSDKRVKIVHGHFFGSAVVPVYALQNQLKGIGFSLHPSLLDLARERGFTVTSCHIPSNDSRIPQTFTDLRIDAKELSPPLLDKFIKYFYRAKLKSKKYARYYVSFLVTALQSIDFGAIDFDESFASQGYGILDIILGLRFEKHFGDVPGVECVYFTLLERAYDSDNQQLVNLALKLISSKRRTISSLESCPESLLSRENRSKLLDYLASHLSLPIPAASSPKA